jgi:CubicO group peptidase (beta-lactamase class C family)
MKSFFCFLFVLLLSYSSFGQPGSDSVEERIRLVENGLREKYSDEKSFSITERMLSHKVHGVSIAVVSNYKIDWTKAYGFSDVETSTPMTPGTMLQAASISKSLNAFGLMRLAQDNKIDLSTDINQYLVSWKFPYTEKGKVPITIANLLSHTGGTTVHGFWGYTRDAKLPTVVEVLSGDGNSASVKSMFDAGKKVQYSGGGTTVTQLLVMDVSGQKYEEYQQDYVLGPLGMTNSTFKIPAEASATHYATGYNKKGQRITEKGFFVHPELAAAGLWTTSSDLAKYIIQMQLAKDGESQVLSETWANKMLNPVLENAGLGVFINNRNGVKYFEHGGANQGFRSIYMGSMDGGKGIVVMVNSENMTIAWELINSVARAYGWDEFR